MVTPALSCFIQHSAVAGDLTPRNCLKNKNSQKLILIDLDAAHELDDAIGTRAMDSSAYVPPEEAQRLHRVSNSQRRASMQVQEVGDVEVTSLEIKADYSYE